jgi:hypothetical protein
MGSEAGDAAVQVDDEPTIKFAPGFAQSILREHLTEYCALWPDQPHAALGGETPRKVAATATGRAQVEALVCAMEQQARGTAIAHACDFEGLRLALGLTARDGRNASDFERC